MSEFSITVDIAAPPERVWAVMSDVEKWPEWTPSVTSIRLLDEGPLAVGSRILIRQPKFPPALWKMVEFEPGRSFTWTTGGLGVRVSARHSVMATEAGSRATLSLQFRGVLGPLAAWLTRGLNARYLNLEATGLKQRSESEIPV